jgi:SAM-dependent methyltransferase
MWERKYASHSESSEIRRLLIDVHADNPYYSSVEGEDSISVFWGPDSLFRRCFEKLDLGSALDFACGHGRHSAQCFELTGTLTLVDANASNIAFCERRFADNHNLRFVTCSGFDLSEIPDASVTGIFSYDAMVHFEALDVVSYIFEFSRVLVSGGRALIHYSVNDTNPEGDYRDDPSWRNFFSEKLMRHIASRANLRVLESHVFTWPPGAVDKIRDGLVLLEKPSRRPDDASGQAS